LSVGIIIPNIAYRAQELNATPFQISLLFTLYSLMQFLCAPLWGHLSDRMGRKPVLLLGLLGNGVGLCLFGISEGLPHLYAARGLSGLMSSAALPTAMAYVADVTDEAGRGRAMGLMGAAMGLGFIFGPGIGGMLSIFGHGVPFLVAGGLNLATCALAALVLRESLAPAARSTTRRPFPSPALAFRSPLLPFYLVAFCVPFAMAALETTFPLLIQQRFGYAAREMGVMFLFMGTAVFLIQGFLLGRWIQAAGEETVLIWGFLINAVGFLLVIAATGRASLTAALVVGGVGNQVMRPTNASLITKRTTLGQGASIGIMDSFDSLGRILGPIVAGSLYRPDPRYPDVSAAAILILAALGLSLRARRKAVGSRAVAPPDGA
ncbi:MAG TPA: MFS transporter, partial [Candidatus Polarisedimenticolia bacterium]|nr:MFS transporter [Candidatus Polarisedimenticolia bacterium]